MTAMQRHILFALATLACIGTATAADDAAAPLVITHASATPSAKGATPGNFTEGVRIDVLHAARAPGRASVNCVTFEPGARTVWHTHPAGQVLVVTAGAGRVQRAGAPVETVRPGDTVWIPPGVKHWHGAGATTGMTHLAVTETVDGKNVEWMEPVVDAPGAQR